MSVLPESPSSIATRFWFASMDSAWGVEHLVVIFGRSTRWVEEMARTGRLVPRIRSAYRRGLYAKADIVDLFNDIHAQSAAVAAARTFARKAPPRGAKAARARPEPVCPSSNN